MSTESSVPDIPRVLDVVAELGARVPGGEVVTAVHRVPARAAEWAPIPDWVRPELAGALRRRGIERLYSHQAEVAERVRAGRSVVVVTPTASGKTLCYNLPVCNAILEEPDTRALYLFPTKALAADQLAALDELNRDLGEPFGVFTFDGDTPSDARKSIRRRGHVVLTNPDMLHAGILPHHTRWARLFENLRYVVLDELHTYRGVFGSHVANVLRRLRRVARFYGRELQFVASSATIGNPRELAEQLLETPVDLVDSSGAPRGERFFVFYNPPVVNRFLGVRRSYIHESARIAGRFLDRGLQTIVFANSRLHTEILLTYLQRETPPAPGDPESIRGYRGGYLPLERREIERDLRSGRIRGVVATNALELGIDVGSLDAAVLAGYPGTIASTWQRAGRAGRRTGASGAVLVASSAPLDQFIVKNPDYFFGGPAEAAFCRPDNLEILVSHLKCAAFELPLGPDDRFGELDLETLCQGLEEAGFLHRSGETWHWNHEAYPADAISLRAVSSDNFVIVDETEQPRVIGEVDFSSAPTTVHPKAIYLHGAEQYHVERMDFEERKAYCRRVDVDYFTQAIRNTEVRILEVADEAAAPGPARRAHGDVLIRSQVVGFKKIKFFTLENVGAGNLELPENEMHTTACWLTLERELLVSLAGPSADPAGARSQFSLADRQDGIYGLLFALESMAALLLLCDRRDLGATIGERPEPPGRPGPSLPRLGPGSPSATRRRELFEPNLYLYDAYPGGIGLSRPLFDLQPVLLERTRELIAACPCGNGCPSCVGPSGASGTRAKEVALAILERLNRSAP